MRHLLILVTTLFISLHSFAQQTGDTIINNNNVNLKAMVLYFHITDRCNTCYGIEANVKNTIFNHFQTKLDSGIVGLTVINCELPEYAALVKKYSAYGATLAITGYKDGKEIKSEDLTNFAFQKTHNPDVFIRELKEKINEYLK